MPGKHGTFGSDFFAFDKISAKEPNFSNVWVADMTGKVDSGALPQGHSVVGMLQHPGDQ